MKKQRKQSGQSHSQTTREERPLLHSPHFCSLHENTVISCTQGHSATGPVCQYFSTGNAQVHFGIQHAILLKRYTLDPKEPQVTVKCSVSLNIFMATSVETRNVVSTKQIEARMPTAYNTQDSIP